jgi:hypothetical protein
VEDGKEGKILAHKLSLFSIPRLIISPRKGFYEPRSMAFGGEVTHLCLAFCGATSETIVSAEEFVAP